MRFFNHSLLVFGAMLGSVVEGHSQQKFEWKDGTSAGYNYKYVTNDPMKTRFYTLKNGLKVILSRNDKEPRIAINIPVRAGSNNDPSDHTGLAHYLEHLLFKGTDQFGSLNWAKEKPLLDKITNLYEEYNHIPVTDSAARKAKYKTIDSVSYVASQYSIANEYDKLMSSIGSQGTNAHTSVEETVYEEDIPSNALDKLLMIQGERFRNPQFRLFHTELEAVYEEKNRGLDDDNSKVWETLMATMFPSSNYGKQTTIGTIDHLKKPSIKAIRSFYDKNYVPNNMAVVMAGDFDPDKVVKLVDQYFAYMTPGTPSDYKTETESPILHPIQNEVYGPDAESVMIGFRIGQSGTKESMMMDLLKEILNNGKAGLIDLNLNKSQKLMGGGADVDQMKDCGLFLLSARPKQDQSLEAVKSLLLEQLTLLKQGKFDSSLIAATIANYKLEELEGLESNGNRVQSLMKSFINSKGEDWLFNVSELDQMSKVTKDELVKFANTIFNDSNYIVIYKKQGEDNSIAKVDKPIISPVETNTGKNSVYVQKIISSPLPSVKPVWVDYKKEITFGKLGLASEWQVPNKENGIFSLYYNFDIGSYSNKLLPIALSYLQYLGTPQYSAEDISRKFYGLASSFSASSSGNMMNLRVGGLEESFDSSVYLFESLLRNCKADPTALASLKDRLLKSRQNAKSDKKTISSALNSYAAYGEKNPFNYTLSDAEIKALDADVLVDILHKIPTYEHKILYYGPRSLPSLNKTLSNFHALPNTWAKAPIAVKFERKQQHENQVLFNDFDMVQSEIFWTRTLGKFDTTQLPTVNLFNQYFGGDMGSVVFQTIRESKALAYSTYAYVQTPGKKEDPFSFVGYVGSQADKHVDAIRAMNELITKSPSSQQGLENGKISLKKSIETERIRKEDILFTYLSLQKQGLSDDIRKYVYKAYDKLTLKDILNYHDTQLAQKPYTYSIMASQKMVNPGTLSKYGKVKILSLEELFGY